MATFRELLRKKFIEYGVTDAEFATHPFIVRTAYPGECKGPTWGFHCPLEAWAFYDKLVENNDRGECVEFVDVSEDWYRLNGGSP